MRKAFTWVTTKCNNSIVHEDTFRYALLKTNSKCTNNTEFVTILDKDYSERKSIFKYTIFSRIRFMYEHYASIFRCDIPVKDNSERKRIYKYAIFFRIRFMYKHYASIFQCDLYTRYIHINVSLKSASSHIQLNTHNFKIINCIDLAIKELHSQNEYSPIINHVDNRVINPKIFFLYINDLNSFQFVPLVFCIKQCNKSTYMDIFNIIYCVNGSKYFENISDMDNKSTTMHKIYGIIFYHICTKTDNLKCYHLNDETGVVLKSKGKFIIISSVSHINITFSHVSSSNAIMKLSKCFELKIKSNCNIQIQPGNSILNIYTYYIIKEESCGLKYFHIIFISINSNLTYMLYHKDIVMISMKNAHFITNFSQKDSMYKNFKSFVIEQYICILVSCKFPSNNLTMISEKFRNTSILYNFAQNVARSNLYMFKTVFLNYDNFKNYGICQYAHLMINTSTDMNLMLSNTLATYDQYNRQGKSVNIPNVQLKYGYHTIALMEFSCKLKISFVRIYVQTNVRMQPALVLWVDVIDIVTSEVSDPILSKLTLR